MIAGAVKSFLESGGRVDYVDGNEVPISQGLLTFGPDNVSFSPNCNPLHCDFKDGFDKLMDAIGDLFTNQAQAATPPPRFWDPSTLDLNKDGLKTVNTNNGANFDHDHNGFAEKSGWVSPEDGLLALDRNGDGIINDGREIETRLTCPN
ncbi:MAG: hypothetical protein HQK55_11525 [Deltaproteobacteria bacterium]|nr:hypothetical protein [Deltaproteobacteria bacterium]